MRVGGPRATVAAVCAAAALAVPASAGAYSLDAELANFAKVLERETHVTLTPEFLALLNSEGIKAPVETVERLLSDPERVPANVCGIKGFECAGDVRFYRWPGGGDRIRKPVVFTARSGATLSGHVWATRSGPTRRPGVVITTGSVQAPEELYWGQAATLAKHGYVVLTYDVQGQGLSDTLGEGADLLEGVPAQEGRPFYDGTEDALDFLLSEPGDPYVPRRSCTTGTSHAAKQARRVGEGHNDAFNPFGEMVDAGRIGIAGHSLGASAVSFVGQRDPRVDAIVAWDNLSAPAEGLGDVPACASAPETRAVPAITKPALGISNDYGIVPTPFLSDPNPQTKNAAFLEYRKAGVDAAEITIRGGCHEESAFIPGVVTGVYPLSCGTLRGGDLVAWYTTAWLDKYVKGASGADARLLTDRWRDDARGAAVDLRGDGNLFSFYFRSRLDVGLAGGGRAVCDDLRAVCAALAPDGASPNYDFVSDAYAAPPLPPPSGGAGGAGADPSSKARRGSKRCKRKRGQARRRCIRRVARRVAGAGGASARLAG